MDVEDRQIRLAWTDDRITKKIEYIDRIEALRLGISYDLLLDAVSEGGGAGQYRRSLSCDQRDYTRIKEGRSSKIGWKNLILAPPTGRMDLTKPNIPSSVRK
ncbi:MAG: hypothetical protein MUO26_01645 [Methanotrichaceae archaeon]|nr:hypothetical protein [Methanotrichaceae archaeon]